MVNRKGLGEILRLMSWEKPFHPRQGKAKRSPSSKVENRAAVWKPPGVISP